MDSIQSKAALESEGKKETRHGFDMALERIKVLWITQEKFYLEAHGPPKSKFKHFSTPFKVVKSSKLLQNLDQPGLKRFPNYFTLNSIRQSYR